MRMPTSKSGGAKFRGPTSSQEYNTNEDAKYLELVELYKQANTSRIIMKEAHQAVLIENAALHDYIQILEEQLALLEEQQENLLSKNFNSGHFFKTGFTTDMTVTYPKEFENAQDSTPRCLIDPHHRFVTIPQINQIPKTHVTDELGTHIIPNSLKVNVGRSSKKGTVVDNDIMNAFNGDELSFWRRTVTYDSHADAPAEGEDVVLEIELPTNLVHNLNINTIIVHPHPERGIEIKDIEMHFNNGWKTIQGFKQNDLTCADENHSPKRKWHFSNEAVQKIRITLVQRHSMSIAGKTVFTLGAQEIGIYLTMFEPNGGMVLTPFEMEGMYRIDSVEHVFLNRNALSYPENMDNMLENNIYDYDIFVEESDHTLRQINEDEWQQQYAKRIWVKTKIYPDANNGVNPCLHAVRLHYTKE